MKDLVEKILKTRGEIATLKREKRRIQSQIDKYEEILEGLEILSVNQLDIFDNGESEETNA